jgi:tetrapyrrole methylase family protein/MazG family protein
MSIYIIGMGVSNEEDLSKRQLDSYKLRKNIFRTDHHRVAKYFKNIDDKFKSFDYLYNESDSLKEVYSKIIIELKEFLKKEEDVNYWVPGHPLIGENTVKLLLEDKEINKEDIIIVPAMSYLDVLSVALKRTILESVRIHDGQEIKYYDINSGVDQIISPMDTMFLASEIKEKLYETYPDDYDVIIVYSPGTENEEIRNIKLCELDMCEKYDHETYLFIPKTDNAPYSFSELIRVMEKLRMPDGCPWDREQTHDSIKNCLIEESYEVIDAIEKQDFEALEEELGDILLQVIFHGEIAGEIGYFNALTIINRLVEKLKFRHPHVFGELKINDSNLVEKTWENQKRQEKAIESMTEELKNLPKVLPNLIKSYKIQKKVARVGFDWPTLDGALRKVQEEINELLVAISERKADEVKEELGDLIFSIVNVARKLNVNPEEALRACNDKFITRFEYIEENLGKPLEQASLKEMDDLWEAAKRGYKNQA